MVLNVLQARQRKGKPFADLQEEKQTDFTFPQADKIKLVLFKMLHIMPI